MVLILLVLLVLLCLGGGFYSRGNANYGNYSGPGLGIGGILLIILILLVLTGNLHLGLN